MTAPAAQGGLPVAPSPGEAGLVGPGWGPGSGGPRVATVRGEEVCDLTSSVRTVSELLEREDPAAFVLESPGVPRWRLADLVEDSLGGDRGRPYLLSPLDLQVVKACGVTFVDSMIERVIEERCGGDLNRAAEVREMVAEALQGSLQAVRPGSRS